PPRGNEQIAIYPLSLGRRLHLNLVLGVPVALGFFQRLDRRPGDQGRPRAESLVPDRQDFLAPPPPLRWRPGDRTVVKSERRSIGSQLSDEFLGWLGERLQFLPQALRGCRRFSPNDR